MINNTATARSAQVVQPVIVCVDDEPRMLGALERLLASLNAHVETFEYAEDALSYMRDHTVSVVVSDMRMPNVSGAEFLALANKLQPDAYRILLTGFSDLPSTVAAINDGCVQRYLSKPWSNEALLDAVKTGVEAHHLKAENVRLQLQIKHHNALLERQVELRTRQLRSAISTLKASNLRNEEAYQGTLRVLFNALSVSPVGDGHFLKNVSIMSVFLATKIGLPDAQIQNLRLAGLLVHLGLLGVNPALLRRERMRFRMSVQDKHELARHPQIAQTILAPAAHFDDLAHIIGCQNEWFNGTGQPLGLSGEEIPIESRILTIARDFCQEVCFTELSFASAVKKGRQQLLHGMNNRYDPALVNVFLQMEPEDLAHFEIKPHGKTVEELVPGMILDSDLYNSAGLLLLPQGYIFTEQSIQKLLDYQDGNDDILHVQATETPECGTTLTEQAGAEER